MDAFLGGLRAAGQQLGRGRNFIIKFCLMSAAEGECFSRWDGESIDSKTMITANGITTKWLLQLAATVFLLGAHGGTVCLAQGSGSSVERTAEIPASEVGQGQNPEQKQNSNHNHNN